MLNHLFHVNNYDAKSGRSKLHPGQVIHICERSINPFFRDKQDVHTTIKGKNREIPLLTALGSIADGDKSTIPDFREVSARVLAQWTSHIVKSYVELVRETAFEDVRRSSFPGPPSRTTCIWASRSIEQARNWMPKLNRKEGSQIVRLDVQGAILHPADGGHLYSADGTIEAMTVSDFHKAARLCWSGTPHKLLESEILLSGTVRVVDIVDD